eukprot:3430978-Rhodomonas_salina.1
MLSSAPLHPCLPISVGRCVTHARQCSLSEAHRSSAQDPASMGVLLLFIRYQLGMETQVRGMRSSL